MGDSIDQGEDGGLRRPPSSVATSEVARNLRPHPQPRRFPPAASSNLCPRWRPRRSPATSVLTRNLGGSPRPRNLRPRLRPRRSTATSVLTRNLGGSPRQPQATSVLADNLGGSPCTLTSKEVPPAHSPATTGSPSRTRHPEAAPHSSQPIQLIESANSDSRTEIRRQGPSGEFLGAGRT